MMKYFLATAYTCLILTKVKVELIKQKRGLIFCSIKCKQDA